MKTLGKYADLELPECSEIVIGLQIRELFCVQGHMLTSKFNVVASRMCKFFHPSFWLNIKSYRLTASTNKRTNFRVRNEAVLDKLPLGITLEPKIIGRHGHVGSNNTRISASVAVPSGNLKYRPIVSINIHIFTFASSDDVR